MWYGKNENDSDDQTMQKLGSSTYHGVQGIAQDLVEGGSCSSYDEAYELIQHAQANNGVISTYRGNFKRS
jgi:hypothetical protein